MNHLWSGTLERFPPAGGLDAGRMRLGPPAPLSPVRLRSAVLAAWQAEGWRSQAVHTATRAGTSSRFPQGVGYDSYGSVSRPMHRRSDAPAT